jgi:tetratricopeptide (TPR) repeat protein
MNSKKTQGFSGKGGSPAQVNIDLSDVTVHNGGIVSALELGKHEGPLTLQVFGTAPANAKHFLAPPSALHMFVGRNKELSQIISAIQSAQRIFLYGMPGVGKTALAITAAQKIHDSGYFKDGILWISDIRKAPIESVCDAIARRLGDKEIPQLPSNDKSDATRELLATFSRMLIVLDHLDSVKTAQALIENTIPAYIPVLVASRQRHSVSELEIQINPLEPDDAICLFREASGRNDGDNDLIGEICSSLENHPLALVISATRIKIERMSLNRLKERLDMGSQMDFLKFGEEEDKHRSVWASLSLSFADLDSKQRLVLTRLSACFDRTVGIELLAIICDLPINRCEDFVGQLVACSLIERSEQRIGLQKLVRDFGRQILGDELSDIQDGVALAVISYLEKYSQKIPQHYDLLEAEAGNLIGAARYSANREDWSAVMVLVKSLALPVSGLLSVRGYWTELVDLLLLGIKAAENTKDIESVGRFRHNLATIMQIRGQYVEAQKLYHENIIYFRAQNDRKAMAATLNNMGALARLKGDYIEASRYLKESREIKEDPLYNKYLASTLHELGQLAEHKTAFKTAIQLYMQSLDLDNKYQYEIGMAVNWQQIGTIRQIQGNLEEGERLYRQSLEVFEKFSDFERIASLQRSLGSLLSERGVYDVARKLLNESYETSKSLGARSLQGQVLCELGKTYGAEERLEEAKNYYELCLKISTSLGEAEGIAFCESKLGEFDRLAGQTLEAFRLQKKALVTFRKLGNRIGIADCFYELGNLAREHKNSKEAECFYMKSLHLREIVGHKLGVAKVLLALGILKQENEKKTEAIQCYQKAMEIFSSLGSPLENSVKERLKGPGFIEDQ